MRRVEAEANRERDGEWWMAIKEEGAVGREKILPFKCVSNMNKAAHFELQKAESAFKDLTEDITTPW